MSRIITIHDFKLKHDEEDLGVIKEVLGDEDIYRMKNIAKHGLVLDIGANIGTFTLYCAKQHDCIVFAYEPSQRNYDLLVENIELNGLVDRIRAFRKAVAGQIVKRSLYFNPLSHAGSTLYAPNDQDLMVEEIDCTTLKSIFEENQIDHCDLLKIDCEGAEKEILTEETKICFNRVQSVMLEWHNYDGHIYRDYLERLGFSVFLTGCGWNPNIFDTYEHPQPPYDPTFGRGMLYAHRRVCT